MNDILLRARELLDRYNVCDACLGRVFTNYEGNSNEERGRKIREALGKEPSKSCYFCMGWCSRIDELAQWARKVMFEYECKTFRIGTHLSQELIRREEELFEFVGVDQAESLKKHINREVGKKLQQETGKKYADNPDLEIVLDLEEERAYGRPAPLYLYGRYVKTHEMPQTKWPCRFCGGRGCPNCDYTGRQWKETVEYYVSDVLLAITMGDETRFHAAGREDIDAFMLGDGRPFVVEVVRPRRRYVDLDMLRREINRHAEGKVKILCLLPSNRDEVRELKSEKYVKVYRALVEMKEKRDLSTLEQLKGIVVTQRTPTRILHRKKDKVRKKKVYDIWWEKLNEKEVYIYVRAESGLYVKEFITGDNGRTRPSVSEVLGTECHVKHLDIIKVEGGRPCS